MSKKLSVIILSTVIAFAGMTSAEAKRVHHKDSSVHVVDKKKCKKAKAENNVKKVKKFCKAKKVKQSNTWLALQFILEGFLYILRSPQNFSQAL